MPEESVEKAGNKKAGQLAGFLTAAYQITSWQRQQQEQRRQEQQRQQQERLEQQRQQQERLEQQRQQQERLEQQELQQQEQRQELQQQEQLLLSDRKQTGTGPTGRRAGRNVSFIFPFNKVITKNHEKIGKAIGLENVQYRPTPKF